jgi:membrane protein
MSYFADVLPPTAFQLLQPVVSELAGNATGRKLTFGIASALWGVSGGISSMISSLNLASRRFIYGAGRKPVRWLVRLGAETTSTNKIVLVWSAIQVPGALLFVAISGSLIYHFGPNLKQRRHWQWTTPGVVFGALIWLAASFGFRLYLHFFNHYSAMYGSLGAVMILMILLYVSGLAYLVGGEINAVIERAAIASPQG